MLRSESWPRTWVLLITLIVAIIGAATFLHIRQFEQGLLEQARTELIADVGAFRRITDADNLVAAIEILDARSDSPAGQTLRYIVIDPETGGKLSGNMDRWPPRVPQRPFDVRRLPAVDGEPLTIATSTLLDGHFPLYAARIVDAGDDLRWRSLVIGLGSSLLILTVGLALAFMAMISTARRLGRMDDALRAFAGGDTSARIETRGRGPMVAIARGVNAMLDLVSTRLRTQDHIAEHIAHELRSPIATALTRLKPGSASEDARQALNAVIAHIDSLMSIIDLEMREPEFELLRLDAIVGDLVELYADSASMREIRIETVLAAAPIIGEGPLIERLAANLLDNAIKYCPVGGTVSVTTIAAADAVELRVEDSGPGMAGLPRVPGVMMSRGPSATGVTGTGLGLAMVQRIARRHNARLHFADRAAGPGLAVSVIFAAPRSRADVSRRELMKERAAQ